MSGNKNSGKIAPSKDPAVVKYVDRVVSRAQELHEADAFEVRERQFNTLVSARQAKATTAMHARNNRRAIVTFAVALVVVVAISLCLPYRGFGFMGVETGGAYSPLDVLSAYALWFRLNVMTLFDSSLIGSNSAELNQFAAVMGDGTYGLIINRLVVTVMVVVCGIMLALSGVLFQTTFRNPIAAPTMLGVSEGMSLGAIVYCLSGYSSITESSVFYVILLYGFGAVTVLVVLLGSRLLSGGRRYNILDMLLLGTVLSQLIGGINQFIQTFMMDDETWENFFSIQQAANALIVPPVQIITIVVFVVTFAVVLTLRFRLNMVAFSNDEGTMMGVRMGALRIIALLVGSMMELAAVAAIGQVAMLSLAVPFLVRYLMAADFRTQLLGNCLVGSLLLLVCMVIQHFFTIGFITIPAGTIVSVIIVPFFVWVIAFSQGKWS